jgi:hypothetical protein
MVPEDPKMSKQSSDDKRKYGTLIIPQQLKIIRKLESGQNQREVTAFDHQLSCDKKKRKDQIQFCMAFSENVEDLLKQQTLKESKLVQV